MSRPAGIYRELAAKDAANPMWRMNLGVALSYAGRHREAASELAGFVKVRPQPGPAHFFLGLSLLKLGRNCEAIAPLESAQRWPARPNTIWVELGDAYRGCKRWEAAAKAYAQAGRHAPKDRRLARQTARCWWMARRYDVAKPLYEAMAPQSGNDPDFQFRIRRHAVSLEGAAAGLPWLEKAVAGALSDAGGAGGAGAALMDLERPAEAVEHLAAAAAADPRYYCRSARRIAQPGGPRRRRGRKPSTKPKMNDRPVGLCEAERDGKKVPSQARMNLE